MDRENNNLIERFQAAFNAVHQQLYVLNYGNNTKQDFYNESFSSLLGKSRKTLTPQDYTFLDRCRDLRNHIVHKTLDSEEYWAIPRLDVVQKLENFAARYERKALAKNPEPVFTLQATDKLSDVMKTIYDKVYSQFPVYEGNRFIGLLTENGITRWIAHSVVNLDGELVNLEYTVADALKIQEKTQNYHFINRHTLLVEAIGEFLNNLSLEAILITHSGKLDEKPLGIITHYDVLEALKDEG